MDTSIIFILGVEKMAKVKVSQQALDFTFDTLYEKGLKLSDVVKNAETTVIHFLRYYGCTLCQLDIREYIKSAEAFKKKNAQLLIVLQSDPEIIKESLGEETLPFDIICDPDQELYKLYDIWSFKGKLSQISPKLISKMLKAKKLNLEHGKFEGNEEQLPALFIIDADMNIKYANYPNNLAGIPPVEEILEMI